MKKDSRDMYEDIPPATLASLQRYIRNGTPTGHFLEAVLENNLQGAMRRADSQNLRALFCIVAWVVNELPAVSWGDRSARLAWIKAGGMEGQDIKWN